MKRLTKSKIAFSTALVLGTLSGCDSGSDPVAEEVPVTVASTSADISGSALKGPMGNATFKVTPLNGSTLSITEGDQTDAQGRVNAKVQAKEGFGINSLVKLSIEADGDTTMLCDAASCAGVPMGELLSGAALTGAHLSTLGNLTVTYGSSADGTADVQFQATALTTLGTRLIEQDIANGRNVSNEQLLALAQAQYSDLILKALGIDEPGADLFATSLLSAHEYSNFVTGEECTGSEQVPVLDGDGNPVTDENGNPLTETQCNAYADVLVDGDITKMSLANAAFAHLGDAETLAGVLADAVSQIRTAMEAKEQSAALEALAPLRQRMFEAIAAHPLLEQMGLTAEEVIDVELAFLDEALSLGPQREVTTAEIMAGATITARNRIGDGESEFKAFDGDVNSKWLDHNDWQGPPTAENPAWIQVQFEQPQAVSSLFITSANDAPDRDPENFNLVASNDGENWVTLAEFVGASFDERFQRQEFRFNNGLEYSHYRLNITKNKNNDGLMQLAEIQFVGPVYASVDHTDPVGTGVITARNRISDGEAESKAFDNDPQTKWLDHNDWQGPPTEEDPSWVQVEFPEPVAVNTLGITSANDAPDRDPENFHLLGSHDGGATWVKLAEWAGESFDGRFQRRLFSLDNGLAYGTYRLNITKNRNNDGLMQVGEIELIGPKVADLVHSHGAGVTYVARNRISDGESEDKAFDGDANTKWLDHNDWQGAPTVENPSWVKVALPQAQAVNMLAITSANDAPDRDPENFSLLGSLDGENWVTLASWTGEQFDERFQRRQWRFANSLAYPHYQLSISKNRNNDGLMQVGEIELIGPTYAAVDHSSAADATYSARNRISDGESEDKAFDDNPETKWLDHNDWQGPPTEENPSWIQVDFNEARTVDTLAITSANDAPDRDPENFSLLGSNDGGNSWTEVASWVGESFDARFQRRIFSFGNGFAYRSYRLNISKNRNNDGLMQIGEIELIGPQQ
ncbi:discoidin domain-containing protein [Aliiglaciecola sp. CAU 1673]|uniref:discoidin domain-containing protein n=1 Tax=Aliiglaciecola sp. CAU 1673 TaxID=3032595 RepID=UPI0023DC44FC|nr:discoidin domain-containing protein [Aliiglaciecola sp. CAU 1673]MDF2178606.1 discoidin domain-containing protein [Aliiglaciecola sp. CAU 1673]